jgi:hypothetical protein
MFYNKKKIMYSLFFLLFTGFFSSSLYGKKKSKKTRSNTVTEKVVDTRQAHKPSNDKVQETGLSGLSSDQELQMTYFSILGLVFGLSSEVFNNSECSFEDKERIQENMMKIQEKFQELQASPFIALVEIEGNKIPFIQNESVFCLHFSDVFPLCVDIMNIALAYKTDFPRYEINNKDIASYEDVSRELSSFALFYRNATQGLFGAK